MGLEEVTAITHTTPAMHAYSWPLRQSASMGLEEGMERRERKREMAIDGDEYAINTASNTHVLYRRKIPTPSLIEYSHIKHLRLSPFAFHPNRTLPSHPHQIDEEGGMPRGCSDGPGEGWGLVGDGDGGEE